MIFPKANKTSLVKLVRSKGYNVPSIQQAGFTGGGRTRSYWLNWTDAQGLRHSAYYTGAGGRPCLLVDKTYFELTLAEVIHFGLVEQK